MWTLHYKLICIFEENKTITSSQIKDYTCENCRKTFSRKYNLDQHIKSVHEGIRNYKCEFCDRSFSHAQSLDRHRFSVHYIRINAENFEKENKIPFVEPFWIRHKFKCFIGEMKSLNKDDFLIMMFGIIRSKFNTILRKNINWCTFFSLQVSGYPWKCLKSMKKKVIYR